MLELVQRQHFQKERNEANPHALKPEGMGTSNARIFPSQLLGRPERRHSVGRGPAPIPSLEE